MNFDELYKIIKEDFLDEVDLDFTTEAVDKAAQYIFASLWADWINQEVPEGHPQHVRISGNDITEIAPPYRSFMKKHDADSLENKIYGMVENFESVNGKDLKDLYAHALIVDGQSIDDHYEESSPENFVFLTLMKMTGDGIAWTDDHEDPGYKHPYTEISYLEFPDSFQEIDVPDDEEEEEMEDWEFEGEDWKDGDYSTGDEWKDQ